MNFKKISESQFVIGITIFNFLLRFFRIWEPGFPYFDETNYYLPAARAYLSGKPDPNFEHPPLAKELIALGIKFFGDNPVGWRFFEILAGTAGIVAIYFLTKKVFGGRVAPTIAAILLTFEFGWFTASTIGIPEIFTASLVLICSYFLYSFIKEKSTWHLGLGAFFLGLAVAAKWSALFFIPVYIILLVYSYRKKIAQVIFPISFLIIISFSSYLAAYLPYLSHHSPGELLVLQRKMLTFHTDEQAIKVRLHAKTPGQKGYSPFVWPINYLYSFHAARYDSNIAAILFFYNPFILWGALIISVYKLYQLFVKQRLAKEEIFLIASFLIFWLVWFFAPRNSYPYYWLSGIPFGIILISHQLEKFYKKDKFLILGLMLAVILSFIFFYPLLSALPVPAWYLRILTGAVNFS